MINKEQENFIRNYMSQEYFDSDKVISYLRIHDIVGTEIFDLALKEQTKRNLRLVHEGVGFKTIDVATFIRRVPFYFYVADFNKEQHGDLLSLFCGTNSFETRDDMEKVYEALERLLYKYNMLVSDIMGYPIKITGHYSRNDIFFNWVNYLDICYELHIDNKFPEDFLYEYNKVLELAGETPQIFEPGLIGFNEDFLRTDREIIISGEFPCQNGNLPILKWIGVWIEDAAYVKVADCYSIGNTKTLEKELHIGLTPDTKIYMPNIYNKDDSHDIWYPIYFGPRAMEFNNEILKVARSRMNITQKELAEAVGVQLRTYQKWEKGDTIPDGYNLIRLMNYLNIESVQEFVENKPIVDDGFVKFRSRRSFN